VPLTATNYKVAAAVGHGDQMTSSACCVLDTDNGFNFIRRSCVPVGVQRKAISKGLPTIIAANKSRVQVDVIVRTMVKVGDVAHVETVRAGDGGSAGLPYPCHELDGPALGGDLAAASGGDADCRHLRRDRASRCHNDADTALRTGRGAADGRAVDPGAVRLTRSSDGGKPGAWAKGASGKWIGGVCEF
jgi:hypothetical protein